MEEAGIGSQEAGVDVQADGDSDNSRVFNIELQQ